MMNTVTIGLTLIWYSACIGAGMMLGCIAVEAVAGRAFAAQWAKPQKKEDENVATD